MKRYNLSDIMKSAAEYKSKYGNRDYRNYRSYYGSRMGRNDWNRDYRNDIKTAINRSASVCNMKF